jgi:hypothetical protein
MAQANAGKPKKSRSEKARSAWRADPGRDEKIFSFINGLLRKKQPVRLTKSMTHTVRAAKILLDGSKASGTRIIPPVGLPHWDHTSPHLKMLAWGMASWELNATPFTLHLSDEIIKKALKDKRGFARHIADRVRRLLEYRLGTVPGFWFSVEKGPGEEPHAHGAIVIQPGHEELVSKALRSAGGKCSYPARQLFYSPKRNAINWVGYATKWMYGTRRRLLSPNSIAANHVIRQAAQAWHQEARSTSRIVHPI